MIRCRIKVLALLRKIIDNEFRINMAVVAVMAIMAGMAVMDIIKEVRIWQNINA